MKRNMIFKNTLVAVAFLATGALITACSDWDDHYEVGSAVEGCATLTIWENISSNANLSQFADLIKKANYDDVLNTSQTFTVWAPLNGTFDYDALTAVGNDKLLKEFVQNHIARNNFPASGAIDERIYMLNEKVLNFQGAGTYSMGGVNVAQPNVPSLNGVLHTLEGKLEFRSNIFESLDPDAFTIDSISEYIHNYDVLQLNESKSIQGPVVDGQLTYLDSVFDDYNPLMTRYSAYINAEDSNYTMIVPTNEAWNRALNAIKPCYNYVTKFTYVESPSSDAKVRHEEDVELPNGGAYWRDSMSYAMLFRGLFYNSNLYDNVKFNDYRTGQKLGADSLVSTSYIKMYSEDAEALVEGTTRVGKSNGAILVTDDSLRLHHWTVWNPLIVVEAENASNWGSVKDGSISSRYVTVGTQNPAVEGELSQRGYAEISKSSTSSNPEVNFYLPGLRSTTYVIYGVFVPSNITNIYDENPKPNKIQVRIGYNNADGKLPKQASNMGDFETNPAKVDTVCFGEFTFPICYYGTDYPPYIRISSRVSGASTVYDRDLRIDRIFLVPKDLDEYLKEHPDYKFNDGSRSGSSVYYN